MGRARRPSTRCGYGAGAAAFAALLLGCGGDAADGKHAPDPSSASELPNPPGPANEMPTATGAAGEEGATGSSTAAEQTQGTPQCGSSFEACGGLVAGSWRVEDTCQEGALSPRARQLWGETVLDLDPRACQDAVQSVTSRWSGRVLFQYGAATDERLRSDTVEMKLSRTCLNATFGVDISEAKLGVCATLTTAQRSCSSAAGACQCSASLERSSGMSGTYGVLDESLAISTGSSDLQFVDYCVEGDLLHWREQGSPQRLLLRREPGGPPVPDIR